MCFSAKLVPTINRKRIREILIWLIGGHRWSKSPASSRRGIRWKASRMQLPRRAEFIALGAAIFDGADPAAAIKEANRLLDEHAPAFEDGN